MSAEVERHRLRRLRLLQTLASAYPDALTDRVLLSFARQDPDLIPTLALIRRSLQYLHDRGLAAIVTREPTWIARALPDGIDYLEGPDPGIEGIRHPSEFLL